MKQFLITILGITCCAGSVYASGFQRSPRSDRSANLAFADRSTASTGLATQRTTFLSQESGTSMVPLFQNRRSSDSGFDLADFAYKISYIGSLILTADQVARSVDSVMDSMQMERPDGSRLRMLMEPTSKGFDVMLKVSRPLEF